MQQFPLSEVLTKYEEKAELSVDATYKQVTVRLHGKGVVERGEVAGLEVVNKPYFMVREGQFILSRIDARNGAFGLVPASLDGAIVTRDFPTFEVNQSLLLPEYMLWLSKTPAFVELCQQASEGTTNRVRLQENRFLRQTITLPPLLEQRRIVGRIEELTGKVEEARRLRVAAANEIDRLVTSLHLKLSQDRLCTLGELIELYEDRASVIDGKEYPQVGIKGFGQGLYAKEAITSQDTSYKWFNRLFTGAIVLSQPKGWEGAIAGCDEQLDGWFVSPEYRTFRCLPGKAHPKYLAKLFTNPWFWNQLKDVQRGLGGRRQRTRPEQFLSMEVAMPTFEEQEQAIAIFDKLDSLKPLQDYTSKRMEAIIPAILDKAFKGKCK